MKRSQKLTVARTPNIQRPTPNAEVSNAGISMMLLDRDTAAFPQRSEFDLVASENSAGQMPETTFDTD